MTIIAATATSAEPGRLTQIVEDFCATQGELLARGVSQPSDWDRVARFVDPARFKRVGAYLEELDCDAYKAFLTGWAQGGTRFEMTVFHITEVGNAVFQEIEERHHRGDQFIRKNVIAVYRFDEQRRIVYSIFKESLRGCSATTAKAIRSTFRRPKSIVSPKRLRTTLGFAALRRAKNSRAQRHVSANIRTLMSRCASLGPKRTR